MRRLALLSALCTACGVLDESPPPADPGRPGSFSPIGQLEDGGAPRSESTQPSNPTSPPAPEAPDRPLAVEFVPVVHDADALRWTDLAFLPGPAPELLTVDKDGVVHHLRFEDDAVRTLGRFTIEETWDYKDAGLLSVTVDPRFLENGYFYVGLSTSQTRNIIQRHHLDPTDYEATRDSATLVMEVEDPRAPRSWHNIGSIGFTDEGYLWALFGDKVLDAEAQNPHTPLGALVRVIPRAAPEGGYTVPPDNPFAEGLGHPGVYAIGLRSPWKGTYHDGRWWFGDVGLDTYEELNRVDAPGQNFGWPDIEGPCPASGCGETQGPWDHYGRGASDPYVRADVDATPARHRSVWVGPVYRGDGGDRYGGRLDDTLLFGDAFSGFVRGRGVDDEASVHVGHVWGVTGMAEGPDGYLYVTALGTWPIDAPTTQSALYRVVLAD